MQEFKTRKLKVETKIMFDYTVLDWVIKPEEDPKKMSWNNPDAKSWKENPRYPMKPMKTHRVAMKEKEQKRLLQIERDLEEKYPAYAKAKRRGNKEHIATVRALLT